MIIKGKMRNKLLAGIMTAACVVTSLPVGAFAAEVNAEPEEVVIEEAVAESVSEDFADEEYVQSLEETVVEAEAADETVAEAEADVVSADAKEAQAVKESELATATEIQIGKEVTGKIVKDQEGQPLYKFTPDKTGVYTVTATSDVSTSFSIFDIPGYHKGFDYESGSGKSWEEDLDFLGGVTYYVSVGSDSYKDIEFSFTISTCKKEVKASDYMNPDEIKVDGKTEYKGVLFPGFREDGYTYSYVEDGSIEFGNHYYHFNVPKNGRLTFDTKSSENGIYYYIKDVKNPNDEHKFIWTATRQYALGSDHESTGDNVYTLDLLPGDYYLKVRGDKDNSEYSFKMSFAEIKPAKDELPCFDTEYGGSNNDIDEPADIEVDQKYIAQSTVDNEKEKDWYRFTLHEASPLYVNLFTNEVGHVSWGVMYSGPNYTDSVSLFGDNMPGVYAPTGIADLDKNVQTGESSTVLYNKSADWTAKKPSVFQPGTYYFYLYKGNGQPIDGYGNSIYGTGAYTFEISTGPKTPVSAVKMIDTATNKAAAAKMQMVKNQTKTFKAVVTPEKAQQDVTWSTSDKNIATVEDGVVTPVKDGIVTITVTTSGKKKDGKAASASCQIEILDKTIDNNEIICQPEQNVAFKEKVNLISADYFGEDFKTDKSDVWVVKNAETGAIDKSLGSVKNGVFTGGKKSGTVKVVRQIKLGKDLIESGSVVFDVEVPAYLKKDPAKPTKDLKTLNVTKKCTDDEAIDISEYVGCPTLQPDKYEIPAKAKGFSISDDGKLEVTGSGTCKVTVYWGYDATAKKPAANAAKIVFTVKSKLPTVKGKASIGANKTVTFKITNTPKNVKFEEVPVWRIEGVDNEGNPDGVEVTESIATGAASTDGMSYNVTGAGAGKIAVIVTIDGIDYWTISQVK